MATTPKDSYAGMLISKAHEQIEGAEAQLSKINDDQTQQLLRNLIDATMYQNEAVRELSSDMKKLKQRTLKALVSSER